MAAMTLQPRDIDAIQDVATLAEPVRRALYEHVVGQLGGVGREAAAGAVGISRALAAFHLDRLVDAGLLSADYRRLGERRGPGAGRPSKIYRRADRELAVSLPERHDERAGELLLEAVAREREDGTHRKAPWPTFDGRGACVSATKRVGGRDHDRAARPARSAARLGTRSTPPTRRSYRPRGLPSISRVLDGLRAGDVSILIDRSEGPRRLASPRRRAGHVLGSNGAAPAPESAPPQRSW